MGRMLRVALLMLSAAAAVWAQFYERLGAAAGQEAPEAMQALLQSRFLRLVSAFLAEDTPTLLSLMDGSLWFTAFADELAQEAIAGDLAGFFARADLSG